MWRTKGESATLVGVDEGRKRVLTVIAASILAAHGFDAHPVVNGGIDSWVAAGKPTVEFRRCGG